MTRESWRQVRDHVKWAVIVLIIAAISLLIIRDDSLPHLLIGPLG